MKFSELKTNDALTKDGVWFDLDGGEFLIASNTSPKYKRAIQHHVNRLPGHKRNDLALLEECSIKAAAEHILLDWRGDVLGFDDKPMEPTPENRLLALKNPTFAKWVDAMAGDIENYKKAEEQASNEALKSGSGVESDTRGES